MKGDVQMQAVANQTTEEIRKAREDLFRELEKGIRDMEQGDVIPHDECMKQIREELGLCGV